MIETHHTLAITMVLYRPELEWCHTRIKKLLKQESDVGMLPTGIQSIETSCM